MKGYQRSKVLPFELGATLVGGQKGGNECPQKIVPAATHIPRGVPDVYLYKNIVQQIARRCIFIYVKRAFTLYLDRYTSKFCVCKYALFYATSSLH